MKSFLQLLLEGVDVTTNKNFKTWFKNSKVVDTDGNPLVVHHGTGYKFTSFDPNRCSNTYQSDFGAFGHGFYFTKDKTTALNYAAHTALKKFELDGKAKLNLNIMDVYLSLQNPVPEDLIKQTNSYEEADKYTREMKKLGYDGIIIEDAGKWGLRDKSQILVFYPTQIKSATNNNGNFDPHNSDITK